MNVQDPSLRILNIADTSPLATDDQAADGGCIVEVQIRDGSAAAKLVFRELGYSDAGLVEADIDDIAAVARRCYLAGVRDAGGDVELAAQLLDQCSRATLAEMEAAVLGAGGASLSIELEGDAA